MFQSQIKNNIQFLFEDISKNIKTNIKIKTIKNFNNKQIQTKNSYFFQYTKKQQSKICKIKQEIVNKQVSKQVKCQVKFLSSNKNQKMKLRICKISKKNCKNLMKADKSSLNNKMNLNQFKRKQIYQKKKLLFISSQVLFQLDKLQLKLRVPSKLVLNILERKLLRESSFQRITKPSSLTRKTKQSNYKKTITKLLWVLNMLK
ncbi:hypothetical protein TTHERM_000086929 (macronuclear) [Tetrahymena thermophila SB210]|uniref:Uncharacterized protein n=1 Tax=Tetrahymena thermophila (strain SB210) TaxID=312017 RepID=W7XKU0_TETTS|nr:hypothetical protein TTHERM_000086929 [Tetrahymena thermophila SB210]EWS75219.1 hypothetical protein TTHERM_000086929 [Tetrahymena thermophila SB210]|eukprot:XP_012652210.1 hypothetical protein TTHERM_000086929 [Tetrahymena thermophila SB210]